MPNFDPFANATATGGTAYLVGNNLVGQSCSTLFSPWYLRGGNFPGAQPTLAAGSLSYPQLSSSSGNSVLFVPASAMSACIDLNLASAHTDTVYYSFLLKITDLSAVSTNAVNNAFAALIDDPRISLTNNQIARLDARILAKKVGNGYVLGTSRSANTVDFVYEPDGAAHNLNDTVLVVGCFQFQSGVQTNVSLWVNPPASSFGSSVPPAPTLVALTGDVAGSTPSARALAILCQFPGAPTGIIDDVRVSVNDWGYVTGGDPAILTQPVNQTVPQGSSAHFSVVARGTPTLTYQWYKDGSTPLSDGGNIAGATSSALTVSSVTSADAGDYSVTVMNGNSVSVTSASAHLALTDPQITSQPQSRTNNYGSSATFQVTATGTGTLKYQWHRANFGDLTDTGNIVGSHSNILTITGVTLSDAGTYSVTVTNGLGVTVDSSPAELTVLDPYFVTQPTSVTNAAGSNVTFHVSVNGSGAPNFTYSWQRNGNTLLNNGHIVNADTDTLSILGITSADEGTYNVVVIGTTIVTSGDATLTVLSPPAITIPPSPRTVAAGNRSVFAVAATGSAPLIYQWQAHGTNLPGGTAFSYTVTNAQIADSGSYSIIVSNAVGAQTNTTTLTVQPSIQLYRTNLIVVAVGDGAQTQTLNGNSMFLHQFKTDGTYVNTVNIPDSGSSQMVALGLDNINGINNGSTTGTSLTRSLDQRFMVIAGYDTNLNYGASLINSPAADVPRGVGLIDSYAQYTQPAFTTDAAENATYWRAAVSDGTNNFWGVSGISGTFYLGYSAAAGSIQTIFANCRSMGLFNGDIYCAGAVSGSTGVLKISGMPTAATTPTVLFAGSSGTYDMVVNPAGNLIYVADQRSVANGGGVQRWEFNGTSWNLAYTLVNGFGNVGPRYVTADFSGANPVLYVTCNDQVLYNNRIVKVVDTDSSAAGTTLASAGVNQTMRGISFGPIQNPVAPRPTLSYTRSGNNLILSWSGAYTLVTSTNAAGPYADVSGATNPYTNNVNSAAQRYFGLRQ